MILCFNFNRCVFEFDQRVFILGFNFDPKSPPYANVVNDSLCGLCPPNKYEVDLSNEVLNIDFGQGTAKISEVKVGGKKNICLSAWLKPERPGSAELADISPKLQL